MSDDLDVPLEVQLASVDLLLAEIGRRMETLVVAYRYRPLQESQEVVEDFRCKGDLRVAQGLACGSIYKINQFIDHTKQHGEDFSRGDDR